MITNRIGGGLVKAVMGIFSSREDKYYKSSSQDIVLNLKRIYQKCIYTGEEEGYSSKKDYRNSEELQEEVQDRLHSLKKKNRLLYKEWKKRFLRL